jgi:hypothetical protein
LLLQNTFSAVSAVLMYCRCATIAAAESMSSTSTRSTAQ